MVLSGWEVKEIGDIAKFYSGGTPSKKNESYWNGSEPWISGKDLKSHYLNSSIDKLTLEGFAVAKKAPKGSTLVLVRGMTLLKDFPVGYTIREVSFNQDIKALVPLENTDGLFLSYLLVSEKRNIMNLVSTAGHGTGRLDTDLLKQYPVRTPPLSEQRKIAKILTTWDKAINTTKRLIENSKQQKKALMQQLLTGQKRLEGFNDRWKVFSIEDLEEFEWVELSRGKVISKKDLQKSPGDYPVYSSSIKNEGLMGKYNEYMFDEELISWSVDGGGDFFYRPKHKYSITNVSGYMRLDTNLLNYRFIAYQLQYLHTELSFDYQTKAHPSVIRKLYFLQIPSIEEQQKIAAVLINADREIEVLEQQLSYLQQEKKALMQQLLTGKRRVLVD